MRHLMSPLDFSVEELDKLMDLAQAKSLPLYSMSQVPVPD